MTDKTTVRYTMDISADHRDRLAALAKAFKINQGEVVEVFLDTLDKDALAPHFTAKRQQKVARRAPKKELYQKFKELTPEQLAAALAAADAVK